MLPFTADGDVVVIEDWRQPIRRINYGLTAGTMEDEDDYPTVAAARELPRRRATRPIRSTTSTR